MAGKCIKIAGNFPQERCWNEINWKLPNEALDASECDSRWLNVEAKAELASNSFSKPWPTKSLKQFRFFYCRQTAIRLQLLENVWLLSAMIRHMYLNCNRQFFPPLHSNSEVRRICKPLEDLPITSQQFNFFYIKKQISNCFRTHIDDVTVIWRGGSVHLQLYVCWRLPSSWVTETITE